MSEVIQSRFMSAKEVAEYMDVSLSSAYRIIKELNQELKDQGKIIVAGKISRRYFEEKAYM